MSKWRKDVCVIYKGRIMEIQESSEEEEGMMVVDAKEKPEDEEELSEDYDDM